MATKQNLDFSQVKDAGTFSPKHKEEGEYLGTITSFEDTVSKTKNAMWVYGVTLDNDRRAVYPVYCLLGADQLWKLRNVMMAAGFKVPKKRMSVDGNRLVGKKIGVYLEDDEYEGKKKSVIASFFPASEYSGPENGDDNSDEELPDEDSEEEEYEDEEEPEDEAPEDDDQDEDAESDDEDGEDEEEDEEPEPTPPPKKKAPAKKSAPARAKPAVKAKAKPVVEDDEDEDEMDVEDL